MCSAIIMLQFLRSYICEFRMFFKWRKTLMFFLPSSATAHCRNLPSAFCLRGLLDSLKRISWYGLERSSTESIALPIWCHVELAFFEIVRAVEIWLVVVWKREFRFRDRGWPVNRWEDGFFMERGRWNCRGVGSRGDMKHGARGFVWWGGDRESL